MNPHDVPRSGQTLPMPPVEPFAERCPGAHSGLSHSYQRRNVPSPVRGEPPVSWLVCQVCGHKTAPQPSEAVDEDGKTRPIKGPAKWKALDFEGSWFYMLPLAVVYVAIALGVFALRNHELTQTQVFLRIWDALLWR